MVGTDLQDLGDYTWPDQCLIYAPYSCDAVYASFLHAGGKGPTRYNLCPSDVQDMIDTLVRRNAFEESAPVPSRVSDRYITHDA